MGKITVAIRGIALPEQNKRKLLDLDAEFEEMEAKITTLKTENLHLQAQVKPLERRIKQLTGQIERVQAAAETPKLKPLEEPAETLLLAISKGFHVSEGGGGSLIQGTNAQAAYHLGILTRRHFIRYSLANYTNDGRYVMTQAGLEYLHKVGKL